jgi:hypothetical protein
MLYANSPILLFGMPRSGTTWLGKIFDSHPDTLYRHEPDTWQPPVGLPMIVDLAQAPAHCDRIVRYVEEVQRMRADRVCAKQPIFPKAYASGLETQLYRAGAAVSKAAGRLGVTIPVLGAPRGVAGRSWRLVWKSIESLGRLGLLLECLPQAQAVQIMRHPCGYVSSVLRGEAARRFTHGGAAEDFGVFAMLCETVQARRRGLSVAAFRAMRPVERLAWRWVLFNEKACEESAPSARHAVAIYEELCFEPQRMTEQLFEFVGLPMARQTIDFLECSTSTRREDYYSVFKDPLESAWRWQRALPAEEIERVLTVAAQSELGAVYTRAAPWNRLRPSLDRL